MLFGNLGADIVVVKLNLCIIFIADFYNNLSGTGD